MKVKLLTETAKLPTRGSLKAAGYDLYADEAVIIPSKERKLVSTGIAIAVPSHHYGRVAPRSGLALKHGIDILAGVIDEDYRGTVHAMLYNTGDLDFPVAKGDRIAQLVIERITHPVIEEVEELDGTERGQGGYGSTGTA